MVFLVAMLGANLVSHAAAPSVDFLFPAGGQLGATNSVEASGKFDPWPVKVWTDAVGLEFKPESEKGKFTVNIGKNVAYGAHLVRFYNEEGASDLRTFIVGRQVEVAEKEPNDAVKKPQVLEKLPVTINGRLDKGGDVDSFAFKVEAGKWVVAMVESYSIGAPVDAYLHLLDENGIQLALGNDSYNLDPVLACKIEKSGTYVLQISGFVNPPQAEVRFAGGSSTIYRLTVTDGPTVRHAFAGQGEAVQLSGWNFETLGLKSVDGFYASERKVLNDPRVETRLRCAVGRNAEAIEREPNNKAAEAQDIVLPAVVNGCLQVNGDEDRFSFTAKKDERFEFRLAAGSLGSPMSAVLRVEDQNGKQLARNDVSLTLEDPKISWTAPTDGKFILAVSDLFRHGGENMLYRLEALPQVPGFSAKTDAQRYRLDPGKSVDIKVNVTRANGYEGKLMVSAKDLPADITAKEVEAPTGKGGEAKLTLTAAAEAKPASVPIRILISSTGENATNCPAVFDFRTKDSKTGDLLVNESDNIWLTVVSTNAAPAAPETKKKKK